MPVVPNFPEPITDLYADQGYFSRLQRAFETAFAAWNKVPHVLTRPPFHSIKHSAAERNEVPDVPETAADVPAYLTTRPCIQPEIIINHRDEAFRRAGCASAKPTSASRLVLWTDASAQKGTAAGWAVAFWDGLNWVRITARGPTVTKKTKPHVSIAELQAIGLALEYAVQFVERKTEDEVPLQIFEVYTDSQPSLILLRDAKRDLSNHKMSKLLRKSKQSGKIVRDVSLKIKKLEEAGVHTEFHWVPRSATLGNMLADKGAGLARLAGEGRYTVDNALVEMMPRPRDEYQWKSGQLPLAHSHEFVDRSCMAEHIASMLEGREITSVEDETMEDTPGESLEDSPEKRPETPEGNPEETLEKAPDSAPEETAAETPGENLEESPKRSPEEISEEESQEESQDSDLNLDLLYAGRGRVGTDRS